MTNFFEINFSDSETPVFANIMLSFLSCAIRIKGIFRNKQGQRTKDKMTSDEFTSVSRFDSFIRLIDAVFGEFNELKTDTLAHFE